jgi:putative transposase
MRQSRFTEERIVAILREHEAGSKTGDVCRKYGVSSATFYKWMAKYGGPDVSEVRRLTVLTDENTKLRNLLAEAMLDNAMLKDLNAKNGDARCEAAGCGSPLLPVRGRSAAGGRSVSIAHRCAIAAGDLTPGLSGQGCMSWQRRGGGLVIAVCFS